MAAEKEKNTKEAQSNYVDHVVDVRRVTKVTKGGKRFRIAAFVVTGDKNGNIGIGLGHSKEAAQAIAKATARARKRMIAIPRRGRTIPYSVQGRHGASRVVIHPASHGTGNIAGGAARALCNAAGIEDVLIKRLGSSHSMNVAKATLNAFAKLRTADHLAKLRGKSVKQMVKES
jgi:small subunit ribosomal protein S5